MPERIGRGRTSDALSVPEAPQVVYGLYEILAATANAELTQNHIYHDYLIARDDAHAVEEARRKLPGIQHLSITRKSDVYPT
jgi:hypothetical protein